MATERDNTFSTGTGGMEQGRDFGSQGLGTDTSYQSGAMDGDQGESVMARARGAVSDAGHKAGERVQERIADQVNRASGQLESVASSLRSASTQIPEESMGRYMLQAATQVDNLATFLNNRDVSEMVDEVESFARRQPAVFIGGAFALGVLGARFLRSSRHQLERDSSRDWNSGGYGDGPTNGESRRTDFGSMARDYPQQSSGYSSGYGSGRTGADSGYASDRAGADSGYSAGSNRASGTSDTDRIQPRESSTSGGDFASDRPGMGGGMIAGSRPGTSGTSSMESSEGHLRNRDLSSSAGLTSTDRAQQNPGVRRVGGLDASSSDSGSTLSGRAESEGDHRDRSRTDATNRDVTQPPDYL